MEILKDWAILMAKMGGEGEGGGGEGEGEGGSRSLQRNEGCEGNQGRGAHSKNFGDQYVKCIY